MDLGSTIKVLRNLRGITQAELALAVSIERPHLSAIEKGHNQPSLKLIRSIAKELCVPPAILLLSEGDPNDPLQQQLQQLWGNVLAVKQHAASLNQTPATDDTLHPANRRLRQSHRRAVGTSARDRIAP